MVNSFALKERRIGFGPLAVISLCLLPLFLAMQSAGPQGLCTQAGHSSPQDRTARGRSRPADTQKLSGTDWVSARSVKAMRQARARLWWPRQDWEHDDQGLVAQLNGGGPRNGEKLTFDSPTFRTCMDKGSLHQYCGAEIIKFLLRLHFHSYTYCHFKICYL